MKKTICILILTLASHFAFSQVIDTTVKNIVAVKINPVKASFQDTALSVYLGAYVISDDLKSTATFYWCLMPAAKDSSGNVVGAGPITAQGNYTMNGEDYAKWCNQEPCNTWPFSCIGKAYGLTFPLTNKLK